MLRTKVVNLPLCTVTLRELSARKSIELGAPSDDNTSDWTLRLVEASLFDGLAPDEMSRDEALKLIDHCLELNGFTQTTESVEENEKK